MLAAVAILGVLLAAVSQLLITTTAQQQVMQRRMLAATEVANVMEDISVLSYAETTEKRLAEISLSPAVRKSLPRAKLQLRLRRDESLPAAKRIAIELSYGRDGRKTQTAKLTTWKYRIARAPQESP